MNHLKRNSLLLLTGILVVGCGDFRGASNPYSYAPATSSSLWEPPVCLQQKPILLEDVDANLLKEKSLSLAEVIDIALHNNPSTKKTWAEARAASALYGQSLKDYFALADFTSDYMNYQEALFTSTNLTNTVSNLSNTNESTNYFSGNTFHGVNYGAQLDLTYTILDFGQTRASSKAALAALHQADFAHNSQIQTTIKDVMNDYYLYLAQKANVAAAEQNVVNAQVALSAVEERFKSGVADMSDKLQATTKLLEEKLSLVRQKQELTYAYTKLLTDMGLPGSSILSFEDYPERLQLYEILDLSSLLCIAGKKRPDLLAARESVEVKKQSLKYACAKRYPTVNASFEVGRERANLGIGSYSDYMLSLNMNFPLFHGFFIQNGIKKAEAELSSAEASLKQLELETAAEITNYFHDVNFSKEAYQYSKEYLHSAQEEFKVTLEEYKAGLTTIVELISAQTAVASAKSKLIDAEKNWYSSIANVSYATGVLTTYTHKDKSVPENPLPTSCDQETF